MFRLVQGISFGAEQPNAMTIVSELNAKNILGKLCGSILSSTALGALLATSILAILTNLFDYESMIGYAWRIPFLLGGVLALASYYIRRRISETPEFLADSNVRNKSQSTGTFAIFTDLFKHNKSSVFVGFGLAIFLSTIVVIYLYLPVYISQYFNYELSEVYTAMTGGMLASFFFCLIFGWLSDIVSKLTILLFAVIGFVFSLFPLYLLLKNHSLYALHLCFIIYQVWIMAFFTSCLPILSRLFPTQRRCTGFALVYNLAFAIAGTLPMIATYCFDQGLSHTSLLWFFVIPVILSLTSIRYLMVHNKGSYVY